jgi:hypothetical protein
MFTAIPATVIVTVITGPAGYLIKAYLTRNRYLPSSREHRKAYSFINGEGLPTTKTSDCHPT